MRQFCQPKTLMAALAFAVHWLLLLPASFIRCAKDLQLPVWVLLPAYGTCMCGGLYRGIPVGMQGVLTACAPLHCPYEHLLMIVVWVKYEFLFAATAVHVSLSGSQRPSPALVGQPRKMWQGFLNLCWRMKSSALVVMSVAQLCQGFEAPLPGQCSIV